MGDSLRREINRGLAESRFGIVILSPEFFKKAWTKYELDGLTAVEVDRGLVCILPVWHEVTKADILKLSPALADKVAVLTTLGLKGMAQRLLESLGEPSRAPVPLKRLELPRDAKAGGSASGRVSKEDEFDDVGSEKIEKLLEDSICPRCEQKGEICGFDGPDGDEFDWFECPHCGIFHVLHSSGGW